MATVGDIGERALIERIERLIREADLRPPDVVDVILGIGDDAAAWRHRQGVEVATTDTMVEGVHFRQTTSSWEDVGWKSWSSNVSDIAAMGGVPIAGLVTLGLPSALEVGAVDALYHGMLDACHRYGTVLVGGDIVSSPTPFVTVSMSGDCTYAPLTRSAARVGDVVAVTGPVGASCGGLRLLEESSADESLEHRALLFAHRRPSARPEIGQRLAHLGVNCAMDISDGLSTDLQRLVVASGVGARIDVSRLPVATALLRVFPDEALQLALAGGEDYELLFTAQQRTCEVLAAEFPEVTVIGEVVPGELVSYVDAVGEPFELTAEAWEHLH